jgi:hypothetical protein
MVIRSQAWLALSDNAKRDYLRMFGKVLVDYGKYRQEVRREAYIRKQR